jgi:hypothetical protein
VVNLVDVTNSQGNKNSGTVTPATPGSITAAAGDLLVVVIAALGTSPTIATPTSAGTWVQIQKTQGATLSFAMYMQTNNAGGAINPSSVLGGTVTGWVASILEFTATGANCGLQGSVQTAQSTAQLVNIFAGLGQMNPELLFCYAVARATATQIIQNTGLAPINQQGMLVGSPPSTWVQSQFPEAGVQGLSLDFFWGTNLAQGIGPYPVGQGILSSAVASVQIAAWFNAVINPPGNPANVYGSEGSYFGPFYSGMTGG